MNSVSFPMKAFAIVVAVVTLYEPPGTNTMFVGYDCSETRLIATLPPSGVVPPCHTITDKTARSIRAEIYEEKGPKTVTGYRCHVRYSEAVADFFLGGARKYLPHKTAIVGREACMEAHRSGQLSMENHYLHQNEKSTAPNQDQFVPKPNYEITLSNHLGLVNFEQNLVHFDNGVDCDFDNLSCSDDQFGDMAWSPELEQQLSLSIFSGNITLVTSTQKNIFPSEIYAVLPHMVSFKVLNTVSFNGRVVLRTGHPDLYIGTAENSQGSYNDVSNLIYSINNSAYAYTNASHVEIAKKLCLKDRQNCNSSVCILDTPKRGLIAEGNFSSAEVNVKSCTQKVVRRRKTHDCFREIPVVDEQGRAKFLKLESRLLVDFAEKIECQLSITSMGEKSLKVKKAWQMPVWVLMILILLLGAWGSFGIVQWISTIKRKCARNQEKESAVRWNTRSYLVKLTG